MLLTTVPSKLACYFVKMACCQSINPRKIIPGVILVVISVIFGVLINYYGLLFENIRVDLTVRTEDSWNTSAVAQRLLNDLPRGYQLYPQTSNDTNPQCVVPNIVHFIWFGEKKNMTFTQYVSILSAHKIQKPDLLMLHCNFMPVGPWWERLWKEAFITIMHREPPQTIHGQRLLHVYHSGDVAKIEILQQYGGIYLDYDVIMLRSMDPLRIYDMTLGKEKPPKFIAGIIVARKNAPFLKLWHKSYAENYQATDWDFNCARVTYQLYLKRQDLLHVEPYRFTTPDWTDRKLLWDEVIDWKGMGLYVIHAMLHLNRIVFTPENIKTLDSTFGEVVRNIYYDSPKLILG